MSRFLPILDTFASYDRVTLRDDVLAGLTTAVMLVPQAMAYAMLAGLDPIVGLYASVLPIAVYALFGSSRQLAVGPVAMVSLLTASAVGTVAVAGTPGFLVAAAVLAGLVGLFQLGMGVARLGFLVNFLSHPVLAGFTSAAALIIGASQLKHLLGVDIPRSHHVHEIVGHAVSHAAEIDAVTLGIGVAAMAALVGLKRFAPKVPRFLLVVVLGALATWGLGLDVAIVGAVPAGLPVLALPAIDLALVRDLVPMAAAISLVAFMESISVARAFARRAHQEVDANQELVGLGLANLAGAVTGGYPVTGGFSRTAVNAQAGARTPVAGLVTAAAVALSLLFLTPLFFYLPKAVLAGIILTAVVGLIDVAEARHLWTVSRPDLGMMALTFASTLLLGIEAGILVGVGASLVWTVARNARPHVAVLGRLPGTATWRKTERHPEAETTAGLLAVRIDGPLFFGNAAFLKSTLRDLGDDDVHTVVLDASTVGHIDASAEQALADLLGEHRARGVDLYIAAARGPVRDLLRRSGFVGELGDDHLVETVDEAVQAAMTSRDISNRRLVC